MKTTVTLEFNSPESLQDIIEKYLVISIEREFLEEGETCDIVSITEE